MRADVEQIQAHVRVALAHGATPREILEALECVVMPMGALAFRRGLQAWAAEVGVEPPENEGYAGFLTGIPNTSNFPPKKYLTFRNSSV